jgi:hypothetical protein
MDLLSIALILVAIWIAIVVACLALAKAAGRSDREADRLLASEDSGPEPWPAEEVSPLDALSEEVMRRTAQACAASEPALEQADRGRSTVAKRLRRPSRLTSRPERIKKSLH